MTPQKLKTAGCIAFEQTSACRAFASERSTQQIYASHLFTKSSQIVASCNALCRRVIHAVSDSGTVKRPCHFVGAGSPQRGSACQLRAVGGESCPKRRYGIHLQKPAPAG